MASYFDDLNIRESTVRHRQTRHNVDIDDFLLPAAGTTSSSRQNQPGPQSINTELLLQTANLFMGFRQQMQQAGDADQEQFLDDLVSQLLEESQSNAKGPPPASKRFIKMLPRINHSEIDEQETCTICKDVLRTSGSFVTKMPCGHLFDRDCVVPWLDLHNTCPLCRHEVETEEAVKQEEYEESTSFMYG